MLEIRQPNQAADRFAALLEYYHLRGTDQPFETQLRTAWVSFGKLRPVTSDKRQRPAGLSCSWVPDALFFQQVFLGYNPDGPAQPGERPSLFTLMASDQHPRSL
jgi:hypothetical protein